MDSLDAYFGTAYGFGGFEPSTAGYESLKSQGLGLISDVSLADHIATVYEQAYPIAEQIPSGLVWGTRRVQLKVYPVQPRFALAEPSFEPAGIKTREFSIQSDQVIELYLERTLTRSLAGIVSS